MQGDNKPVDYLKEATSVLAGNAVFSGTSFNNGPSPTMFDEFSAVFNSDAASAANGARIEASDDNATWTPVATATLAAGVPQQLIVRVCANFLRAALTQGAGAGTVAPTIRVTRRQSAKGRGTL